MVITFVAITPDFESCVLTDQPRPNNRDEASYVRKYWKTRIHDFDNFRKWQLRYNNTIQQIQNLYFE